MIHASQRSASNLTSITTYLLIGILLQGITLAAFAESKPTLEVHVSGAQTSNGQFVLSVFDSETDFLKHPVLSLQQEIDQNGESRFVLTSLPMGRYAISVYHDEDKNGELNTGFMGIPNELVGFSNNAKGLFGPPGYDKVSFDLDGPRTIVIRLTEAGD